ncbi:MAG: NrfD/PsrC family molybdoenzyme membrane anchor subunit [Chloroflexota bacterium]
MRSRLTILHESYRERLERTVLAPLLHTSAGYYAFVFFLVAVIAWGIYAYSIQLRYGLIVTGARDVVMYGLYIVNFVFFIGISYAGALVSAILRLTRAGWRTPITRMSEIIAVGGLLDGALQPIIDMGRPDRVWHIITYGRFQSPLLWDFVAIITYLMGSLMYLYLPLIPDMAFLRDRLGQKVSAFKRRLFTLLAVGWKGTEQQRQRLESAIGMMAIIIIPLAVSVHTVVAFIFSMTLRPGWNSTIYGIYFVIGAVFSGTAVLIIIIAIFRRAYHLEEYITEKHFRNLGYLLLTMLLFYLYLTFTEYLTIGYKLEVEEKHLLESLLVGKNAPWFWFFGIAGMVVPLFLLAFSRRGAIRKVVTAAVLVALAMWFKRFIIVVPSLQVPLMPFEFGTYTPTWVEWSIMGATLAGFTLMVTLATKIMPVISLWEISEEAEKEPAHAGEVATR